MSELPAWFWQEFIRPYRESLERSKIEKQQETNMNFFEALDKMHYDKCDMLYDSEIRYRLDRGKLYCFGKNGWGESGANVNGLLQGSWQIYEEPKCNCPDNVYSKDGSGIAGCTQFNCNKHGLVWLKPKETKGLWEADKKLIASRITLEITNSPFASTLQSRQWVKALHTFMELKGHPLTVKPSEEKEEYVIRINTDENILYIEEMLTLDGKLTEISPTFEIEEDAEEALNDIGKENLLHMFKTFSGLYE